MVVVLVSLAVYWLLRLVWNWIGVTESILNDNATVKVDLSFSSLKYHKPVTSIHLILQLICLARASIEPYLI